MQTGAATGLVLTQLFWISSSPLAAVAAMAVMMALRFILNERLTKPVGGPGGCGLAVRLVNGTRRTRK